MNLVFNKVFFTCTRERLSSS